jgi:hypothetical protein
MMSWSGLAGDVSQVEEDWSTLKSLATLRQTLVTLM